MPPGEEEQAVLKGLEIPPLSCPDDDGKKSADLAELEKRLESERDGRKEERFYWIFAMTIMADMQAFQWIGWPSTYIFLLEVVALILLANHLGVDLAVDLLKGLLKKVLDKLPNMKNE